jgi:hypothetical protein
MSPHSRSSTRGTAKFGYRSQIKVENFEDPAIFWQPDGRTYCLNMTISECFSLTIWRFFFFVGVALDVFWSQGDENLRQENTAYQYFFFPPFQLFYVAKVAII